MRVVKPTVSVEAVCVDTIVVRSVWVEVDDRVVDTRDVCN